MTVPDWEREEVREGTSRMLALRSQRTAAGARPIGWKLAFGAPASLERFGLSAPLVGFLMDETTHPSPAVVSCAGWKRPVAEPEIAVYIGRDVAPGSNDVSSAIEALGPAIELADVSPPPEHIAEIVAGNIYHKAVVLGQPDPTRAGGRRDDLQARITHDGDVTSLPGELDALTGDLIDVVGHCARLLTLAGSGLSAGDVVIIGSVVPPLPIEPGQDVTFELTPLPPISVSV